MDSQVFFDHDSSMARHRAWIPKDHPIPLVGYTETHYVVPDKAMSANWEGKLVQINGDVNPVTLHLTVDPNSNIAAAFCDLWLQNYSRGCGSVNSDSETVWKSFDGMDYFLQRYHLTGNGIADSLFLSLDSVYKWLGEHSRCT
ncbi:MAG: hypothetical protein ABI778_12885 [Ignavibacteriota bacterium]